MYLYRVKIPQGYIFEEVLYFTLKPGDYPFGKLEFVKKLDKDEEEEYNKIIRLLEKISITEKYISWNKYKITTPKGFTFEVILPSGLEPDTYPFGKVEIIRTVPEDEQKHEILTILALWEEHLPVEKI